MRNLLATWLTFGVLGPGLALAGDAFVRLYDNVVATKPGEQRSLGGVTTRSDTVCCAAPAGFDLDLAAYHGEPVLGGGTLSPIAPANPAIINSYGVIAFMAYVDGADRNQGIFTVDSAGLHAIAIGCGGGGGSGDPGLNLGDPSPIGGRFTGFFGGTVFAPPINHAGDVLFIADVFGGTSPRGMFLYQAAAQQIIKIVAVNDPSPLGGTLDAIGPGSMNNNGDIVFLGRQASAGNVNILKWRAGVLSKVVAVGDASPTGGTFSILAGESFGFQDGSTIPSGVVSGLNDSGQVSFFSTIVGSSATRGLFVSTAGVHQLYVQAGEASPTGGTFFDFSAPILNNVGQIAFYADISLGGGNYTAGWFVGMAGSWRKTFGFFDIISGYPVYGLALSRNPIQALDDCGSVLMWCAVQKPDTSQLETTVLCTSDGVNTVVAQQGQATPIGGNYTGMQAWPALNQEHQGLLSAYTPGAGGGGIYNAHFVYTARTGGDLDGDKDIDLTDLAALLANYGSTSADFRTGDLNSDGVVDLVDLTILLARYGVTCG